MSGLHLEEARRARRAASGLAARRPGRLAGAVVVALLLGLAAWSVAALQPPATGRRDAPAGRFSAARAFAHVQRIAAAPHVVGSAADDARHRRLVATLTGLGLDTRVQSAVGDWPDGPGATRDGLASATSSPSCPAPHSTGRLFLMAHHDSVQNGPGASDDAAGCRRGPGDRPGAARPARGCATTSSSCSPTARRPASAAPRRSSAAHPLAADGGVVLNLEARGTGGPPIMFETSPGNAALAAHYAAAVPHPVATQLRRRGLPGAAQRHRLHRRPRRRRLHRPEHRLDRRRRRLPHRRGHPGAAGPRQPAGARATTRWRSPASSGTPTCRPWREPAAADATYFPVLGRLVALPRRAGLAARGRRAARRRRAGRSLLRRRRDQLAAADGGRRRRSALVPLVARPAGRPGAVAAARRGSGRGTRAMLDPWRPGLVPAGRRRAGRRRGPDLVRAAAPARSAPRRWPPGALVWLAVLGAALAALAPGGSYLAALARPGRRARRDRRGARPRAGRCRPRAALVGGAVAVVVLAPTVALFFPALGLKPRRAPAFVATLLAVALLPALELLFPRPASGQGAGGVAAAAVPATALVARRRPARSAGLAVDRFDAGPPGAQPARLRARRRQRPGLVGQHRAGTPAACHRALRRRPGRAARRLPYLAGGDAGHRPGAGRGPARARGRRGGRPGRRRPARAHRARRPRSGPVRLVGLDLVDGGGQVAAAPGCRAPIVADGARRATGCGSPSTARPPTARGDCHRVRGRPGQLRAVDGSDGLDGLPGYAPRPAGVRPPARTPPTSCWSPTVSWLIEADAVGRSHRSAAQVGGAVHVDDRAGGEARLRRGQPERRRRRPPPGGRPGRTATGPAPRSPSGPVQHLTGHLGLRRSPAPRTVTEMPCGASATAIDWAKAFSPAFEAP